MMRYILSPYTNPCWNLALEQYVFDSMDKQYDYFMLWQNYNAVIVGKNQNTAAEVNAAYIKEHGINVVRRLSGGGAVYHDLGNLNFTFIADTQASKLDFSTFCKPVVRALDAFGVCAEISGRNDMTIDGKKFSGNSMYMKKNRIMHHGTIMYDSDLDVLSQALNVSRDKVESKGIKSVSSRVTNIKDYMKNDWPIEHFIQSLSEFMRQEFEMEDYFPTDEDLAAAQKLCDERYSQWEWNYGLSLQYNVFKERRFDGCGKVEISIEANKQCIADIKISGDFFGNGDLSELSEMLKGKYLREEDLLAALKDVCVEKYIHNLSKENLVALLME